MTPRAVLISVALVLIAASWSAPIIWNVDGSSGAWIDTMSLTAHSSSSSILVAPRAAASYSVTNGSYRATDSFVNGTISWITRHPINEAPTTLAVLSLLPMARGDGCRNPSSAVSRGIRRTSRCQNTSLLANKMVASVHSATGSAFAAAPDVTRTLRSNTSGWTGGFDRFCCIGEQPELRCPVEHGGVDRWASPVTEDHLGSPE